MPGQIIVTIPYGVKDGTPKPIKVEPKGYPGKECSNVTRAIEAAMGKTTSDTKTPEYFRQQATRLKQGA